MTAYTTLKLLILIKEIQSTKQLFQFKSQIKCNLIYTKKLCTRQMCCSRKRQQQRNPINQWESCNWIELANPVRLYTQCVSCSGLTANGICLCVGWSVNTEKKTTFLCISFCSKMFGNMEPSCVWPFLSFTTISIFCMTTFFY